MSAARDSVTVRVPGSTSNCGAGFDTLGLALTIYNRVTLTRVRENVWSRDGVTQPVSDGDRQAQELVTKTAEVFFRATDYTPATTRFRYHIEGDSRGARTRVECDDYHSCACGAQRVEVSFTR